MADAPAPREWVAPTGNRRWNKPMGRKMVEAWRRSGESRARFASRHGIGAHRLKYWIDRVEAVGGGVKSGGGRQPIEKVTFAPVRVVDSERATEPVLLEVVIGAATVRVPVGFDEAHLQRVLAALAVTQC